MRVGITGMGGFMGRHLAQACRARNYEVRGLDLSGEAVKTLQESGYEVIQGSVTDVEVVRRFCTDLDVIVHTAAMMKEDGDWSQFRAVNVEGTECVAQEARKQDIEAFIHISSIIIYGYDFPKNVSEDNPLKGKNNPYYQTKIESEIAARKFHDQNGMGMTVVRPGDVYGPGSLPWVIRPLDMIKKRMLILPGRGQGMMNPIHIDDLVEAYLQIIENKIYGETFNLTDGVPVSFLEYFSRLARMIGRGAPPCLPLPLLRAAFLFIPKSVATRAAIDFVTRKHGYSIENAKTKFDFAPKIKLEQGLEGVEE